MRTLKYAILGLLMNNSMTGYDILQQFQSTLCEFWNAKHSQIYPELKKLTNENMVNYKVEISGKVLEKKLYYITEEGKRDFLEWLSKVEPMEITSKDIFKLRLFFSNNLEKEKRIALLEDQLHQHNERLSHLKENQKKYLVMPEKESNEFSDYMLLMGGVMREETTCRWLEECIRLLK